MKMRMRKFLLAVALIATFAIVSCNVNNKASEQTIDSTTVVADSTIVLDLVVDTLVLKK